MDRHLDYKLSLLQSAISNGDFVLVEATWSDMTVFKFFFNEGCDEVLGAFAANECIA
jgi:hypothetical protein